MVTLNPVGQVRVVRMGEEVTVYISNDDGHSWEELSHYYGLVGDYDMVFKKED